VAEAGAAGMARGALGRAEARMAGAVTGGAGPGGSGRKPEGRVCFAVAAEAGTWTETVDCGARGRARVRRASVAHALGMVLAALSGTNRPDQAVAGRSSP